MLQVHMLYVPIPILYMSQYIHNIYTTALSLCRAGYQSQSIMCATRALYLLTYFTSQPDSILRLKVILLQGQKNKFIPVKLEFDQVLSHIVEFYMFYLPNEMS